MDADPPATSASDEAWMDLALAQARLALEADEVPVGAIVVRAGEILGRGHNLSRTRRDPRAHAEMLALDEAFQTVQEMRIPGAVVFTTIEPCFMCAGALSHARVERVVWGARDPKFGGCASLGQVLTDPRLNHRATITEGVRAAEAAELLRTFFRSKRGEPKSSGGPTGPA